MNAPGALVRVASVTVAPAVIVAMLVVVGAVSGWPLWASILVGAAVVVGAVFVIRSWPLVTPPEARRPRWLQWGQTAAVVLMVMVSVTAAAAMYGRWTLPDQRRVDQTHAVADAAATIARLLTSITADNRNSYMQQLRPLVTDDVAHALHDNVVAPLPPSSSSQAGVVRSVGVEAVNDGAAIAIAVVTPTPAPPPRSVESAPSDIILWLLLAQYEDRWVLADFAPLGVRPGFAG